MCMCVGGGEEGGGQWKQLRNYQDWPEISHQILKYLHMHPWPTNQTSCTLNNNCYHHTPSEQTSCMHTNTQPLCHMLQPSCAQHGVCTHRACPSHIPSCNQAQCICTKGQSMSSFWFSTLHICVLNIITAEQPLKHGSWKTTTRNDFIPLASRDTIRLMHLQVTITCGYIFVSVHVY